MKVINIKKKITRESKRSSGVWRLYLSDEMSKFILLSSIIATTLKYVDGNWGDRVQFTTYHGVQELGVQHIKDIEYLRESV